MPADLFVYGLVAAGLIFWLRNILGTRDEDGSERSHAFSETILDEPIKPKDIVVDGERIITPQDKIIELATNPTGVLAIDNKTAENGLLEISKADKNFDIDFFLNGVQDAFAIIVEAFAKGERETLKDLLDEPVYSAFEGAISEREALRHKMETEIHAIKKAEVIEAKLEDRMALVTVRFRAEETSVTRDELGEILEGHPDKTTEMRDIWTFGRDIKSRDPRWLVYATRGDFDGDNDIIPDTE